MAASHQKSISQHALKHQKLMESKQKDYEKVTKKKEDMDGKIAQINLHWSIKNL